jgi:uncharacterized protein
VNKKKLINDPVYGFITIPSALVYDIIEEPVFQRLRRIKQLGLTEFVYPGALHTRFHHALGAMHLMGKTISALQSKGHKISDEECEAAQIAILLHDVGHGPFSHALESTILSGIHHEQLSVQLMNLLNEKYDQGLAMALQMFTGSYHRKFFHQLISSQLDVDRLDYLQRDCFFTGVSEGAIGADRIIEMLEVVNDNIVVQEKGIYSIENFLNARRFMYWQVYLHKTTLCTEMMLVQTVRRAKMLVQQGENVFATQALMTFMRQEVSMNDFVNNPNFMDSFSRLDDYDIWASLKMWVNHADQVLAMLSSAILNRKLFKIRLTAEKPSEEIIETLHRKMQEKYHFTAEESQYLVLNGTVTNAAYLAGSDSINILTKRGEIADITESSDLPNIKAMRTVVKKHYLCWHRSINS